LCARTAQMPRSDASVHVVSISSFRAYRLFVVSGPG
jgi:hypothetical protein